MFCLDFYEANIWILKIHRLFCKLFFFKTIILTKLAIMILFHLKLQLNLKQRI